MPVGSKLRCHPLAPPLRVALVEPEIPPNTGAVARTCAATQSPLHLIGPLGFSLDERAVRRAGLDYWHAVDIHQHADLEAFEAGLPAGAQIHCFSAGATASYLDARYAPGDALVFGRESVGLSPAVLTAPHRRVWGIPTSGPVRSLNLSNAVAIVVFEALRQLNALYPTFVEAPLTSGDR